MFARHIVVVEDDSLLRDLIATSLESVGYRCATAATAADAKRICDQIQPDGVVVDVELGPGPTGFDFVTALLASQPEVAVVFLTSLPDPRFVTKDSKSIPKQAAYLSKSSLGGTNDLLDALDAVLSQEDVQRFRHDKNPDRPLGKLSSRQLSVLSMVSTGMSNQQIAEARGTTVRAVEGMISRVFEALNIDSNLSGNARVEAARAYLSATGSKLAGNS